MLCINLMKRSSRLLKAPSKYSGSLTQLVLDALRPNFECAFIIWQGINDKEYRRSIVILHTVAELLRIQVESLKLIDGKGQVNSTYQDDKIG